MKTKNLLTIILIITFLFSGSYIADAQNNANAINYQDLSRTVYWFPIQLNTYKEKNTGIEKYKAKKLGSAIQYGSVNKYDKVLWNGLSNGSRILIGPFDEYENAEQSSKFYNLKTAATDTTIKAGQTYYWYLVSISKAPRLKSWEFERMPAQVANGNKAFFLQTLEVSLSQKKLVIGPFTSQAEAEESKRLFRLEE